MAYRIAYNSVGSVPEQKKRKWSSIISVILILALVMGALTVKAVGLPWIREVLLPGDPDVTAAALEQVAEDLRCGVPLYDAVKTFCLEIMEHGSRCE